MTALSTKAEDSTIWLTTRQLAKRVGVSVDTVHSWTSRGHGPPCYRFTQRCIRYRLEDVEAWIAASFAVPKPQGGGADAR
jgi:excisionase family DNA binding protein